MKRKQIYHVFMDHDEKYDREWLEQTVQRIEEEFKQERERNARKIEIIGVYPNFLQRRLKRHVTYPPISPEEKERLRQELEELLKRSEEQEAKRPINRLKRALNGLKDTLLGHSKDHKPTWSLTQAIDELAKRLNELLDESQTR